MNKAIDILLLAKNDGVDFVLTAGQLQVKVPRDKSIDPKLLDEIRKHKELIIDFLTTEGVKEPEGVQAMLRAFDREQVKDIPLSYAQERLWFIDQFNGSVQYHMPWVFRIEGALNTEALEAAFKAIMERHEILRTVIRGSDGVGFQEVLPFADWRLSELHTEGSWDSQPASGLIKSLIDKPFDLSADPMLRVTLLTNENKEQLLVVVLHHIAFDGWSIGIMVNELAELYNSFVAGVVPQLTDLAVQYADYAVWQKDFLSGPSFAAKLDYWNLQLAGVSVLDLLPDYSRPASPGIYGAVVKRTLDKRFKDGLVDFSNRHQATNFMVLLTVFNVLLSRYTGQQDICIGTPIAGRDMPEVENLLGFFVNTLALRTSVDGESTFDSLLQRVKIQMLKAFEHKDVPFERIVESLGVERDMGRNPIFQVMFSMQNEASADMPSFKGISLTPESNFPVFAKVDLHLDIAVSGEELVLNIVYRSDLYRHDTIERMLDHYVELLDASMNNSKGQIGVLNMVSREERQRLLETFNNTAVLFPADFTIVECVEANAVQYHTAAALLSDGKQLSYAELNCRSSQFAHYLRSKGVGKGDLVAVCMDRCNDLIVAMLGILKAGAVYVPVDPSYPVSRINYMLDDTGAKAIVTIKAFDHLFTDVVSVLIFMDEEQVIIDQQSKERPGDGPKPDDLAYVIYTSGSTGTPKGVMIRHGALMNLVHWHVREFEVSNQSRATAMAGIGFDAFGWEVWPYLSAGACVYLLSDGERYSIELITAIFARQGITHSFVATALAVSLIKETAGQRLPLRYLLTGGDRLPPVPVKNTGYRIVNNYGPTENTVVATSFILPETDEFAVPLIGKPVSNTQAYILDSYLQLAPQGVAGELCISGSQLAEGYLNLPVLTAEKFISHPFNGSGEKLYRTGDKARWLADGNLEFLGRVDDQIKLRGYRIEPGEVEAVLQQVKGVRQAIVLLYEQQDHTGQLVAFIVPEEGWDKELALAHARRLLPDYMVPAILDEIKEIPLTANGKADRKKLLEYITLPADTALYVAPQTTDEVALATVWNELLNREKTSVHDNFFASGGHSLLAMRFASALRKMTGKEVSVRRIFEYPTIASLASWLSKHTVARSLPAITKFKGEGRVPLSFEQERLWFIDKLHGSLQYHIPWVLRLNGDLDIALLNISLRKLVERHEVLRTVIKEEDGTGYQQLLRPEDWKMEFLELSSIIEQSGSLEQFLEAFIRRPFDLSAESPLKVLLIKLQDQEYLLVGVVHHIAFDGWSTGILVQDLAVLYTAAKEGTYPALKELPLQYSDYAAWQRKYLSGKAFEQDISYWKRQLQDVSPLSLVTDFPRPAHPSTKGGVATTSTDRDLLNGLLKFSHERSATLFMTLLAAFKTVLYRYTSHGDICVGTPVAGRQQQELEGMIGFFLNTLVLRSEIDPAVSFDDLLERVKKTTLNAYEHQDVPFEKIVEALGTERDRSRNPLFQVWMVLQNMPNTEPLNLGGVRLQAENPGIYTSQFDLNLDISEGEDGLYLSLTYCSELYRHETAVFMLEHYKQVLTSIVANSSVPVAALEMVPSKELALIEEFNRGDGNAPAELSLVDLFHQQVTNVPTATALSFESERMSYQVLDRRSDILAGYLISHGVRPGDCVGLCIDRSFEMIVGITGVLKTGAAYVPMDPSYPADRIEYMIADSGCRIVLTTSDTDHPISTNIPLVYVNNIQVSEVVPEILPLVSPGDLAYIIYTSGSSGRPKGVLVEHGSVVNLIESQKKVFGVKTGERVLQFSNYCFDASVEQIFLALLSGATLVIMPKALQLDIPAFEEMLSGQMISHLHATPGFLELITPYPYPALKRVIAGGEACPVSLAKKWEGYVDFYNEYGPTETTVTAIELLAGNTMECNESLPIGRPLSYVKVYLLDAMGSAAGIGVPAEIYIGGVQVARGYRNLPDRTAESFIQKDGLGRLYRTGDKGRWMPDGNIEFLGRVDDQVKIRGYRIEPAEVESVLQQAPGINRAVVLVEEDGHDKKLVGYIVVEDSFDREEVLLFLNSKLPEYMIPYLLLQVDEIPLTVNGKVDKKKLNKAFIMSAEEKVYEGPRDTTEEVLVSIWEELLEVEKVSIHDNFFELGGHSLLGVRVVAAIRNRLGKELPIVALFEYPTIARLSATLPFKDEGNLLPSITRYEGTGNIPLSFSQERLWFIDQLQGSVQYHMPWVFRLKGELDRQALEDSFRDILYRHEILRTVIREEEGKPYQMVMPVSNWKMRYITTEDLVAAGMDTATYISEQLQIPYDLSQDSLLKLTLIGLSETEHILIVLLHHIAFDGWSISVMVKELAALYNCRVGDTPSLLNELPIQYKDYAAWQRSYLSGKTLQAKLQFWKDRLTGVAPLDLPLDYPRPAIQSTRGNTLSFIIDKETTDGLNGLSQQHGVTLFMTLSAVFKILLSRYTGQEDIAIGTPVANRSQTSTDGLIGFFVNTIVLRDSLDGDLTFTELLQKVKTTALEAYANQDTPFEKIVEEVAVERSMSYTPLFQVLFALQNTPDAGDLELSKVSLSQERVVNTTSKFDLYFDLLETDEGLQLQIEYCIDLFHSDTIGRMYGHYLNLLRAVVRDPNENIGCIEMVGKNELAQLKQFNDTEKDYGSVKSITGMFEAHAEVTPDMEAVVFEGEVISYAVLNRRANQLAHYLISCGIGENRLVMVCLERSVEMIVAVLAILKAGGAYVPVDPQYPRERIAFMLGDADAALIITSTSNSGLLSKDRKMPVVLIDGDWNGVDNYSLLNPDIKNAPGSLGYVIYTSGSTGTPKGVQLTRDGLTNLLLWQSGQNVEGKLRILQFASLNFDVSFQEIFTALCFGNTLCLISEERRRNMQELMADINMQKVTSLFIPYVVLKGLSAYAAESGIYPSTLREIFTAGEQLKLTTDIRLLVEKTGLRLMNQYGPSEAHVVSAYEVQTTDYETRILPPVGRPIANTQLYVAGKNGMQSGIGIAGELWIGGVQVGRGYLNRPELTAEKFIEDRFLNKEGARLYRTGDKARWLPDGNIEFLGRLDDQVKIHGYRIELGEVEAALQKAPGVRQAVVLSNEDHEGTKRLAGYIVPEDSFDNEALLGYLRRSLPAYMIPAFLIPLDVIPVTPNGKVDKRRLPEADISLVKRRYVAPRTLTEEKIVHIWEQLLGVQPVSIYDHFFEVGGHSLLVTRMAAVIRNEFEMEISVRTFFQLTTPEEIANYIDVNKLHVSYDADSYEAIEF